MRSTLAVIALLLVLALPLPAQRPAPISSGGSCESLASLALTSGKVTSAAEVAAGAFVAPGQGNANTARALAALPPFCRVTASLAPTSDSDIKIEVWMPKSGWNGKFQAVGNGGWAGTISYPALAAAVAGGYASASTDTGHDTPGASFALGHPEKLIDFAHRAVHEMTVQAKAVVNAYYKSGPSLSFWNGCSTGGRQGIAEASKYPADFDGIVAGATPEPSTRLHSVRILAHQQVNRPPGRPIPAEKYPAIHAAAIEACDKLDGVTDGVIENPTRCKFDPKVLECAGADGPSCLTPPQVESARILYSDVKDSTGKVLYAALLQPGSELGWATLAGSEPLGPPLEGFKFVVFKDPNWDWKTFNASTDIAKMDSLGSPINTAVHNLKPFFDRGGRLLMYHGWNDQQVSPLSSVNYYNNVVKTVGSSAVGKSIQLYMVPGMMHCQGGQGTDAFDKMAAIEQWVSQGKAPAQIVASRLVSGKVERTRPLCPYPQVARYKGTGSTDEAASFVCAAP